MHADSRNRPRPPGWWIWASKVPLIATIALILAPVTSHPIDARVGDRDNQEAPRRLDQTEQQSVRLVQLPVTVTDRRGRDVAGLTREEFTIYEDHVPQEIRFFSSGASEPVSVAFLLDMSGSMRQLSRFDQARQAIREFIEAFRPEDRFALVGFADGEASWVTRFTSDRELFFRRLEVQEAFGRTALYDAVAATPGLVDAGTTGRKAIVLITDGVDNASTMNTLAARRLARGVSVPIYPIGLSGFPGGIRADGSEETIQRTLELFADETGGRWFPVHEPEDLRLAIQRIEAELRTGYVIGYYPRRTLWDGSFRQTQVDVDRRRVSVRTRKGYYARP